MTRKEAALAAPVVCDRCGETIRAGVVAVIRYDEKSGECKFEHKLCPGLHREFLARRPDPRTPRKPVHAACRGASENSNRKVR
jgi:ribosomal protein L32